MRIGVITGIVLMAVAIIVAGYLLMQGTDSSQNERKDKEHCQMVVDGFKDRGPLEELTAEDARCMELLR